MELAGPLGTPLGLVQWKRASSGGEAGTSGFLSVLDSGRRVPAELGQESQASSCLRKGTPLASRGDQGVSAPSSNCVWNLWVFPDDARGCQCPFVLCLHPQGCLRRGIQPSGSYQDPLRGLEGVPGLPRAPQDAAGLTRKFEKIGRHV